MSTPFKMKGFSGFGNESPLTKKEKHYSSSMNAGYDPKHGARSTEKIVEGKGKKEKAIYYERDDKGEITRTVSKKSKSGSKRSTKSKTPKTKIGQVIAARRMKKHTKKAKKSGDTGVTYDRAGNKITTSYS